MVNDEVPQDRAGDEPDRTAPARATRRRDADPVADRTGRTQAAEQLLPLVYEELRKLAAAKMAQEKPGQTLQATALVHEAYIRLVDADKAQHWDSPGAFLCGCCRSHAADSGGAGPPQSWPRSRWRGYSVWKYRTLTPRPRNRAGSPRLARGSRQLAAKDPRKAELVKLRFFAGLTIEEAAQTLGTSPQLLTKIGLMQSVGSRRNVRRKRCARLKSFRNSFDFRLHVLPLILALSSRAHISATGNDVRDPTVDEEAIFKVARKIQSAEARASTRAGLWGDRTMLDRVAPAARTITNRRFS